MLTVCKSAATFLRYHTADKAKHGEEAAKHLHLTRCMKKNCQMSAVG